MRETGKENRTWELIDEKTLELDKEMWEENQKTIYIINEKTFQPGLRTEKEKPRFIVRGGTWLEQNTIQFSAGSNCKWFHLPKCRLLDILALGRQIFRLWPASDSIKNQIDSDSYLLPHLARFVARLFGCLCFCLRGSMGLTIGLAIGGAVSIVGEVAVGLSNRSLWNKLMSFLRY